MRKVFILLFLIIFFGCKKDLLPKPKAYLSLTYPEKTYEDLTLSRPYSFKVSKMATIINEKNNAIIIIINKKIFIRAHYYLIFFLNYLLLPYLKIFLLPYS